MFFVLSSRLREGHKSFVYFLQIRYSERERERGSLRRINMSSSKVGGGARKGIQDIPSGSRKIVQSLTEIVNSPEAEIYAMLKECNMDPNETVSRLLSQGSSFFLLLYLFELLCLWIVNLGLGFSCIPRRISRNRLNY